MRIQPEPSAMKIQIASDLHLEARKNHFPELDAFEPFHDRDLLVLAGDIDVHMQGLNFVLEQLKISPVLYVPGNHEYYVATRSRLEVDRSWREVADDHPNLYYLVAETAEIGGVHFFGAPWHSNLWGRRDPALSLLVSRTILEFRHHRFGRDQWTLETHLGRHSIETELLISEAGNVDVVVTHWPPTKEAIHSKYTGDPINPYFINDHEEIVRTMSPNLWISGHTHEPYDYWIGNTRCVANPSGYPGELRQSDTFRRARVVEITPKST